MNAYVFDPLRLRRFLLLLAAMLAVSSLAWADAGPRMATVKVGTHALRVEVVSTDADRAKGLMHRTSLGANDGMLFVFDEPAYHSMWMKNTLIPLSVAFIDEAGVILNIADMKPLTTEAHAAAGFARYALEMNQGWFATNGIRAGAKVLGLEAAPKPK